ncbi:hypothetical protein T06_5203 [Trichinella sp. T6]|nr:hypothetical protein T06_5203 [Trichinella sp. T6]
MQKLKVIFKKVQLRQTPKRGNKFFLPAQFKRYRRREPRVLFGHRRSLMVRRGSGSKPPRSKPLIYRRAASRGIVSKTMEGSNFS